ncbi:MAG: Rv1733c family protein [Streptosporangiaceae bacterium]
MTRLGHKLGTSWLARLLRRLRLDRNPLRRGSDRAETVVLGALLAAFLAAAPFTAHAAGSWAHASAMRDAQAQQASLHQVTATLSRAAPVLSSYGSASDFAVEARWRAPDGRVRTGELLVTADLAAGHSTRIWVDRTGRLTGPPLSRDQVTGRVQLAAGVAVGGLDVVLIMAAWLVRSGIDRRRMAAWDADWLANGPRWSPRR